MKNKNGESRVGKILGISFFATGVLMLVIAIVCAFFSWNTKKNSEKVIGTITEIYSIREDGYNRNNGISVEYFYDGQEYEADISEYSSNMRVGRRISLYVNKKDPQRVRTSGLLFLPTLVLCCIGIPFFIIGCVFLLVIGKKKKKKQYLMQNGKRIMAEVTGGSMNYGITVNGRHPWKLECQYKDIYTGEIYLFSSGNVWIDPEFYRGQQVAVYVDANNYKNHYVDVESLISTENSGIQIHDYR